MSRTPLVLTGADARVDGLLMASVDDQGTWSALRCLHEGMAEVRRSGGDAELAFVYALADDGRIVQGRHPDVQAFVLGYRRRG